jgi:uncharacterized protein (DUF2384 family)
MTCIEISDVVDRLAEYYTLEKIAEWLNSPHPQLDGETPTGVIAAGRKADVLAIIGRLDSDAYL